MFIFLKIYTVLYALFFFLIEGCILYGLYKDKMSEELSKIIMSIIVSGIVPIIIVILLM